MPESGSGSAHGSDSTTHHGGYSPSHATGGQPNCVSLQAWPLSGSVQFKAQVHGSVTAGAAGTRASTANILGTYGVGVRIRCSLEFSIVNCVVVVVSSQSLKLSEFG